METVWFIILEFKNSNITITQCQKNFADCVMVKFEFLNYEQFFT